MAAVTVTVLVVLFSAFVQATPRNYTIDDSDGDERTGAIPSYGGVGWTSRSREADCPQCVLNPSPAEMFKGTWHESSTFVDGEAGEIRITFTGTDFFVYCALVGPVDGATTQTHLSLSVDGKIVDTFDFTSPKGSPAFQYDKLLLSTRGLENKEHNVIIINDERLVNNVPTGSVAMFDYALYTVDVDATSSQSQASSTTPTGSSSVASVTQSNTPAPPSPTGGKSREGVYLGVGIGLCLLLALTAVGFFLVYRRRRRHRDATDPFTQHNGAQWHMAEATSFAPPPPSYNHDGVSVYPAPTGVISLLSSEPQSIMSPAGGSDSTGRATFAATPAPSPTPQVPRQKGQSRFAEVSRVQSHDGSETTELPRYA